MTVRELIELLEDEQQDAQVIIAESQYTWESVLVVLADPDNDESHEIDVGGGLDY